MPVENADVSWAVEEVKIRARVVGLYRDYYNGNHRLPWATERWNEVFRALFERFRDNLCPAVVNAKADRLQLTAVTAGGGEIDKAIARTWRRERLLERNGQIHKDALKEGDAFVMVWPDETNNARWYVQRGDRMAVRYAAEPQGDLEVAAKLWPVTEPKDSSTKVTWRLNLYYQDRIERFVTEAQHVNGEVPDDKSKWNEFAPLRAADDDDEGPDDNRSVIPNDYGVIPVFPFPNDADIGSYGRSELQDAIPLQDALNKSVANMLVGGEFVALPWRYITGIDVEVDENNQPRNPVLKTYLDRMALLANPNAKVGELPGADLTKLIAEQDSYRAEIARVTRTPLHYLLLSGDFPSGEALGAAERPLMSAVEDRQLIFGSAHERATSFSLRVENVDHDPEAVNAVWKNTAYKAAADAADEFRLKKELGVPDEQIWREMGYDEDQIKEFSEAKAERTVAMQASFDAGQGAGVNPEGVAGTPAAPFAQ